MDKAASKRELDRIATLAAGPPTGRWPRASAWTCYFILGCGMLAPWNALISAADYYAAMWPGRNADRLLTICYLPVCLVFLLLTMQMSAWTRVRLLVAYFFFAVTICIVPITDLAMIGRHAESGAPEGALYVVLAAAAVTGFFDGVGQGALYGDASLLPPEYTHAVVGGTASAGTLICVLRAITKGAAPETLDGLRTSSIAYFFLSGSVCALSFFLYGWVMPHMPVIKYYRTKKIEDGKTAVPHCETARRRDFSELPKTLSKLGSFGPLTDDTATATAPTSAATSVTHAGAHGAAHGANGAHGGPLPLLGTPTAAAAAGHAAAGHATGHHHHAADGHASGPVSRAGSAIVRQLSTASGAIAEPAAKLARTMSVPLSPPTLPAPTVLGMLKIRWKCMLGMFMIYVVTLSIFPGFLAEDAKNLALGSWYPVILFLIFNVADLVSKLAPHFNLCPSQWTMLVLCLCRVAFGPAFYLAAHYGAPAVVTCILTLLLGLTNGYFTALLFKVSGIELTAIEGDLCANMMVVSLVAGLNVGAYLGFLWLLVPQE